MVTSFVGGEHGAALHPISVFPHDPAAKELFRSNFDQTPFLFPHSLHAMEIFQMPALIDLARRVSSRHQHKSHFEIGKPEVTGQFSERPKDITLVEALEGIATSSSFVILKRIHQEPEYREALDKFIDELSDLTKINLRRKYYDPILTIFITSPNRITPYHLDSESNFLAQIQGAKWVHLYNARDPKVMTQEETELYWTNHFGYPRWNEDLADGHWAWEIAPGTGVFNPATFPHWLKNGNNVSVSVSINFKRVWNAEVGAHRTNYYLRRMGLKPTRPGASKTLDRMKFLTVGSLYNAARSARRTLRSRFDI